MTPEKQRVSMEKPEEFRNHSIEQWQAMYAEARNYGIIATGSQCCICCIFCSERMQGIQSVRIPIRNVEKNALKHLLKVVLNAPSEHKRIKIGGGYLTRYGEPFYNPNILQLCEWVAEQTPTKVIYIETNGSSPHIDLTKLIELKEDLKDKLKVALSVCTLYPEYRLRYLNHPKKFLKYIKSFIELDIHDYSVLYTFDKDVLHDDISKIKSISTKPIICNYLSYTRFANKAAKELSQKTHQVFNQEKGNLNKEAIFFEYPEGSIENEIRKGIKNIKHNNKETGIICTNRLFPTIKEMYTGNCQLIKTPHNHYGGNISAAGLLTISDILDTLRSYPDIETLYLPEIMFVQNYQDILIDSIGCPLNHLIETHNLRIKFLPKPSDAITV